MSDKKRCLKCSSTQVRYRLKTEDYQCYSCGHSWKENKEELED